MELYNNKEVNNISSSQSFNIQDKNSKEENKNFNSDNLNINCIKFISFLLLLPKPLSINAILIQI